MAKIVGKLVPEDDYTHALGPEKNFNESMYFNFFDRARAVGGFVRLGNRANEGQAEMTVTVFLPDGRVLFNFGRPHIASNDAFDAGGMRFEVLEPTEKLRTTYAGHALELREPRAMSDPRKAFTENPLRSVALDLVHTAVGPMYGSSHDETEDAQAADQQFAKAHYEQHMRVAGSIEIEGERIDVDGYGLRDHSWGPRYWQALEGYEWLTMNFGADFGAMVSVVRRSAGKPRTAGVVVRGDAVDIVEDATIEIDYEPGSLYHRALRVDVRTRNGDRQTIEGAVKSFIPLRNRRAGATTHVGEGMTEWRCGDRVGYGLSELLRQVG
jgi:hypothetical protein